MSVRFVALTPVFIVDAVAPTRAFFADRLGFAVLTDVEHDGTLGFSMLQRGDVTVMVQSGAPCVRDTVMTSPGLTVIVSMGVSSLGRISHHDW